MSTSIRKISQNICQTSKNRPQISKSTSIEAHAINNWCRNFHKIDVATSVLILEPALQSWGRRRRFFTKSDITLIVIQTWALDARHRSAMSGTRTKRHSFYRAAGHAASNAIISCTRTKRHSIHGPDRHAGPQRNIRHSDQAALDPRPR